MNTYLCESPNCGAPAVFEYICRDEEGMVCTTYRCEQHEMTQPELDELEWEERELPREEGEPLL